MRPQMFEKSRDGILVRVARQLVAFYDWLSGPPMTAQQRLHPQVVPLERERRDFYLY
jgi:hypothetical protein